MLRRLSQLSPAALILMGLLSGCLFQEDSGPASLTPATLAETGLVGNYDMFFFRLEYTDGTVFDSSNGRPKAWMRISDDSSYVQRVWVTEVSTDTRGRIISLRARGDNRGKGEMSVSLEGTDMASSGTFEVRGDTLTWVVMVEPGKDGRTPGFTETLRYRRAPP